MARTLIKSGTVVAMDAGIGDIGRRGLLIEDDRIAAIAPHIEADDAEVIDAAQMIVMPGFVNATWRGGSLSSSRRAPRFSRGHTVH